MRTRKKTAKVNTEEMMIIRKKSERRKAARRRSLAARLLSGVFAILITATAFNFPAQAAATLVWPVPASHTISQGLHDNNAIDIAAPVGTTVVAAVGGTVTTIYLCPNTHYNYGDCHGFGTGLVILGDDGRAYQYAHMQAGSIPANVYYGARVNAGQTIGKVGQTGYAYGPHLHFGISYTKNYWESGPNPQYQNYSNTIDYSNVRVGNQRVSNISQTNARIDATLYKNSGLTASTCGIYLGTSTGSMTKRNTETVGSGANNCNGGASFNIWYDLTGELGIVLKPGTTYYYRVYAVVNGREIKGDVSSFKTLADPKASAKPSSTAKPKAKKAQRMISRATRTTVSYKQARKKAQTFRILTFNAKGKITYKSSSRYITVKNGKVTVRKGTPKGTYKITVRAAGNSKYKACTKTITIRVK